MRPIKSICFQLSIPLFIYCSANAQQAVLGVPGEKLLLEINESYRGDLTWQSSTDGSNWQDLTFGKNSSTEVTISQVPGFYRAAILELGCEYPHFSEVIKIIDQQDVRRWSDQASWEDSGKPQTGSEVLIPKGEYFLLDENTPALGGLTIDGTLVFDEKDLSLTSEWILINTTGSLEIGSPEKPFSHNATINLTDNSTDFNVIGSSGTRGIIVSGGTLALHGEVPKLPWTKLTGNANQGATSLQVEDASDFAPGDEIIITPTDYYLAGFQNQSETQLATVQGVDGNSLTISEGLNAFRWGILQYVSNAGVSSSSTDIVQPPHTSTPVVLDERAEVAPISRNIVIQAPNDNLWSQNGFGAQTMVMKDSKGNQGRVYLDGVQFRRSGQAGRTGGYPFHCHNQSLSMNRSQLISDVSGQYLRNSVINGSANRGVVLHNTNGFELTNNVIFDVLGHAIFLEDATEQRNEISGNLVAKVRAPSGVNTLMPHEDGERGPSGFWITNPNNTIENNVAVDCRGFGYWLAFPANPWRDALAITITPNRMRFGVFNNNEARSNGNDGFHLDDPEIQNNGTTAPVAYLSCKDNRCENPFSDVERFTISGLISTKNLDNGSWERGPWITYDRCVFADNCGRFSAGSGAQGMIMNSTYIGTSLNHQMNGTGRPAISDFQFFSSSCPTGPATYHSTFSVTNCILTDFDIPNEIDRCGVAPTDDLYIRAVSRYLDRYQGNLVINSYPGTKLQSFENQFVFSGAVYDPLGLWNDPGRYLVDDVPFLTFGKEVRNPNYGSGIVGGVSVPGPYYSCSEFVFFGQGDNYPQNRPYYALMPIQVIRYDENFNEVGTWSVAEGNPSQLLPNMRHFAIDDFGYYLLTVPDGYYNDLPNDFQMTIESMKSTNDTAIVGVEFDSGIQNLNVFTRQESNQQNFETYSEVSSFDDLVVSAGRTYWQDIGLNRVWVKLVGGVWEFNPNHQTFDQFEEVGYEPFELIIRPQ